MQHEINVAIIQKAPVFLNLEASMDLACQYIKDAVAEGAEVVVFPETWLPGYPIWLDLAPGAGLWDHAPAKALFRVLSENSITIPGPHFKRLRQLVMDLGAYVVMGLHERDGGTLYNTMLFLAPDGSYRIHRKLMPTYTERMVWGRGDGSTLETMAMPAGSLGGLICWEHWMPLARAAMHARGEVLHVAQWPMVKDLHQIASRHYAFEGSCFVAAAGCVLSKQQAIDGYRSIAGAPEEGQVMLESMSATDKGLLLRGGSSVIAPDTRYIVEPKQDESVMIHACIDTREIAEAHLALDTDGHYSRPDVFSLEVNTEPHNGVTFK